VCACSCVSLFSIMSSLLSFFFHFGYISVLVLLQRRRELYGKGGQAAEQSYRVQHLGSGRAENLCEHASNRVQRCRFVVVVFCVSPHSSCVFFFFLDAHFSLSLSLNFFSLSSCSISVAILFMFDLTRKSTLSSVKEWYRQARGFNKVCFPSSFVYARRALWNSGCSLYVLFFFLQSAVPFLVGTKYDQFADFRKEEQEEITKLVCVGQEAVDLLCVCVCVCVCVCGFWKCRHKRTLPQFLLLSPDFTVASSRTHTHTHTYTRVHFYSRILPSLFLFFFCVLYSQLIFWCRLGCTHLR
jgi:hypothetical protein